LFLKRQPLDYVLECCTKLALTVEVISRPLGVLTFWPGSSRLVQQSIYVY